MREGPHKSMSQHLENTGLDRGDKYRDFLGLGSRGLQGMAVQQAWRASGPAGQE